VVRLTFLETEEAARLAGFMSSLTIISEPEAAALYAIQTAHNPHSQVRANDRIIVCDAGGGTVDLISYDVKQVNPRGVHECAPGTGGLCGSSFIDRRFMDLFQRRMGPHYQSISKINRLQISKNFEVAKLAFRNDPERSFFVNIPEFSTVEEVGIRAGNFEISADEMRSLFDPVIAEILELIRFQVETNSTHATRVNSILMAGGFGESEYLYQRIMQWANPKGIQVIQPRDCSTAIVRGAVMKGILPNNVEITRRARRSYGTRASTTFINGFHNEVDAFIDPLTGVKMAKGQITWFLRKGDTITDTQETKCKFIRNFKKVMVWNDELLVCEADIPPRRMEPSVQKLCTLRTDLQGLKKSQFRRRWKNWRTYYVAEYDLSRYSGLGPTNISISFQICGR
jgi:molecular chaperone DnaK (HSP70)